MSIIGLIPARGGSKSIRNKNIVNFLDKPLLCHVADSAKKSKLLSHIICSTDDKKIMKVCDSFDIEVQVRPISLSQDDTNIVDVIKFVIEKLIKDNVKAEIIVLLQPTYPFVTTKLIDRSIRLLKKKKILPQFKRLLKFHIAFMLIIKEKLIRKKLVFSLKRKEIIFTQNKEKLIYFHLGI